MSELRLLGESPPIPKDDPRDVRALYAPGSFAHPGRMRVTLVRWLLGRFLRGGGPVGDPYTGAGTTAVACAIEGPAYPFIGCELDERWQALVRTTCEGLRKYRPGWFYQLHDGAAEEQKLRGKLAALLFSPEFANARHAGEGSMQDHLRASGMVGGGRMSGLASWRTREGWTDNVTAMLRVWGKEVLRRGPVLLHAKRFVREGRVVKTEQWAADAMRAADLVVEGMVRVPLAYTSHFQAFGGGSPYPLRAVVKREGNVETFECQHTREVKPTKLPTKRGRCMCCPRRAVPRIDYELVVVGRRP